MHYDAPAFPSWMYDWGYTPQAQIQYTAVVKHILKPVDQQYVALSCDTDGAYAATYRYGFNGKGKDDEVAGKGNWQDYGFRTFNPRLGRFSSVDPLANKFPTLTPYQFASNMPIWAMDQDGREALIINSSTKTGTIVANVYYVTVGPSSLANTAMLKKEVESQIINRVAIANAAAQKETPGIYALNVKINSFSKDAEGKPLTLAAARDLAANSSVTYTDMNGQSQTIQSWKTGVVVKDNDGELQNEYAIYTRDNEAKMNTIVVRDGETTMSNVWDLAREFVHEVGHFLGVEGHPKGVEQTDPGITSREHRNVGLQGTDVLPMINGATRNGERVKGTP